MRVIVWLLRGAVFFVLFAFALNNQHEADIHWFFGREWRAPMVFIVLGAFAGGCALGAFAMLPSWWQQRRVARRRPALEVATAPRAGLEPTLAATLQHPPRDGL